MRKTLLQFRSEEIERRGNADPQQWLKPLASVLSALMYLLIVILAGALIRVYAQTENRQSQARESAVRSPEGAGVKEAGRGADRTSPGAFVTSEVDYRIGPNDVIEIQIEDAPELSGNYRVTAAGTFQMPYLGRVKAGRRTTDELARLIADGLRERYLTDPRVMVGVRQINSHSFFVQGSVRNAGVFQVEGKPTLLEMLTLAGGLTQDHGSTAFIIRRLQAAREESPAVAEAKAEPRADSGEEPSDESANKAQYTLLKVNVKGLFRGSFDQNLTLEPGDIVNIPATDVFFVAGEVHAPGSFPLKEGTTLRQAISLAQGFSFKAAASRGIIFREQAETGKRQEIHVDISAIMNGKQEDVPIQPNDIIIVPNSRMKSVATPLLSAFGLNMITRLPIRY
ncbi:MAG TPA: polysaccharide biosynthesis/export family protein [Blastocatellia bacterium]|nr:polysaccharide biosynthesis/export family protein [Blastocatellia bacterium]